MIAKENLFKIIKITRKKTPRDIIASAKLLSNSGMSLSAISSALSEKHGGYYSRTSILNWIKND
jgi:intein-encoded DNA endonuclease-like protein